MRSSTLALATAAAGTAMAADTMQAFLPVFDRQPLVATSIGGNADATTYVVGCKAGTPSNECGMPYPMVMVNGPKTAVYNLDVVSVDEELGDFSYHQYVDCILSGTTIAICTVTMDGPAITNTNGMPADGQRPTSAVATFSGSEISSAFQPVTIIKETASIMNYGTDAHGKPTSYGGAKEAAQTGMVTSKAVLPTQTGAAVESVKSGASSFASKVSSAAENASGVATSTSAGFAAQVTGLGSFAAAAVAAVLGVAAL